MKTFLIFTCALGFGSSTRIMLVQIVFQRVPATTHSNHYVIAKNLIELYYLIGKSKASKGVQDPCLGQTYSDKYDRVRVANSILSFAKLVQLELLFTCASIGYGAHMCMQVLLAWLLLVVFVLLTGNELGII